MKTVETPGGISFNSSFLANQPTTTFTRNKNALAMWLFTTIVPENRSLLKLSKLHPFSTPTVLGLETPRGRFSVDLEPAQPPMVKETSVFSTKTKSLRDVSVTRKIPGKGPIDRYFESTPPRSSSHHQDYYILTRESLYAFFCLIVTCCDNVTHYFTICSAELSFCGMYTNVDMLQSRGRAALRRKAENATVTGRGVNPTDIDI